MPALGGVGTRAHLERPPAGGAGRRRTSSAGRRSRRSPTVALRRRRRGQRVRRRAAAPAAASAGPSHRAASGAPRTPGIWTIQAGLFPENTASLALHDACGFRIVGRPRAARQAPRRLARRAAPRAAERDASRDRRSRARSLAEAIGTFALVFAGCGAIMVDRQTARARPRRRRDQLRPRDHGHDLRRRPHLGRPLQPGGDVRVRRDPPLPARRASSPTGRRSSRARWPRRSCCAARWATSRMSARRCRPGSDGQAFLWEAVLTFFLMFVIMAVATDTRAVGEAAAIAIGGTVGLDAMFGGPITGASMNPARSLGPAIAAGDFTVDLGLPRRADRRRASLPRADQPTRSRCARRRRRSRHEPRALRLHPERRPLADGPGAVRARRGRPRTRRARPGAGPPRTSIPRSSTPCASSGSTWPGGSPHQLDGDDMQWADVVVTMGCGDECPFIPGKRYIDWELDDPSGRPARRGAPDPRRDRSARRRLLTELAGREEVTP